MCVLLLVTLLQLLRLLLMPFLHGLIRLLVLDRLLREVGVLLLLLLRQSLSLLLVTRPQLGLLAGTRRGFSRTGGSGRSHGFGSRQIARVSRWPG